MFTDDRRKRESRRQARTSFQNATLQAGPATAGPAHGFRQHVIGVAAAMVGELFRQRRPDTMVFDERTLRYLAR